MTLVSKSSQQAPPQQYQLKVGVIHHPSLKTLQLVQFLTNQSNEFLKNDLPQYIKAQEKFITILQNFNQNGPSSSEELTEDHFEQFVGLLLIYSTSSEQSYQYLMDKLHRILDLEVSDLFLIVVEMDNSDKQTNMIGDEGERYCKKNGLQFVKLSLYNSEDLITLINRNLYQLVENYYYPNQVDEDNSGQQEANQHQNNNQRNSSNKKGQLQSEYSLTYDERKHQIVASKAISPKKQQMRQMLDYASELRKSRQKQIIEEQQQIDASIQNVQSVLNNINTRIQEKLDSGWFTNMTQNLYFNAEKGNQNYSKIKLTQQFIDQDLPTRNKMDSHRQNPASSRYSGLLSRSTKQFNLNFNTLKPNMTNNMNKVALAKIVLFLSKENVIELQVYEGSTYQQLAVLALRRFGISETIHNVTLMSDKVRCKIQSFSKQLQKAIKSHQYKKIHQRTFIGTAKSKNILLNSDN